MESVWKKENACGGEIVCLASHRAYPFLSNSPTIIANHNLKYLLLMKFKKLLLLALMAPLAVSAQVMQVDRTKWVDYEDNFNPDWSLMKWQGDEPMPTSKRTRSGELSAQEVQDRTDLPTHINAADTKYFPPVFTQVNGSCGSASRICYMLTHELNAYRDLPGNVMENQLPSHFVYNLTYGNSGKDEFIQYVGVPSAKTYGGRTNSSIYGSYDWDDPNIGWMNGYDKWYEAMFNRAHKPSHIPVSLKYAAGRKALKSWLYDHNGDPDFKGRPGIVGIGVASANGDNHFQDTPANREAGVVGKRYLTRWGTSVDHALTIVGYDDRVEFDLDGDHIYGEGDLETDDPWGEQPLEKGAWIIVNSWGKGWENGGFIYCPYAWSVPAAIKDGTGYVPNDGWWTPEVYRIKKDYRPLRTMKVEVEYTRRSEMAFYAGVSADLNATNPEKSVPMHHFIYAGDGQNGARNPAPEVPMLGKWTDGFHHEPMEFGYDITGLSEGYDRTRPLKYFFIIERKRNSKLGTGRLHNLSVIDYENNLDGIETPFDLNEGNWTIDETSGSRIVYSTIVYGSSSNYAPENLNIAGDQLAWQAPINSGNAILSYNIYCDGVKVGQVNGSTYTYTLTTAGTYHVTAVYAEAESAASNQAYYAGTDVSSTLLAANISKGGFTIPNVFGSSYEKATIEFWIRPHSLLNWNQTAGSWGTWMMHANEDGSFSVGWDTSNRVNTGSGTLTKNYWKHICIVVNRSTLTIYVNGANAKSISSSTYLGLGGFGDLTFNAGSGNSFFDADIAEFRIWKRTFTASEVKKNYTATLSDAAITNDLLAYYRGDIIDIDGAPYLRDCAGGNHAPIASCGLETSKIEQIENDNSKVKVPTTTLKVSVDKPQGDILLGQPVTFTASPSTSAVSLVWDIPSANINNAAIKAPTVYFPTEGTHQVVATVTNRGGKIVSDTLEVTVTKPELDATFSLSKATCAVGETVTFIPESPIFGYQYEWITNISDYETKIINSMVGAATYNQAGVYSVQLNVKFNGQVLASDTKYIEVKNVAPVAAFDLSEEFILVGDTVNFYDKSTSNPTSWTWIINNDYYNHYINGRNPIHVFNAPGKYNVSLTVANELGGNTATRNNAVVVCNGDSKSGLNFNTSTAVVTTSKVPFTSGNFTIEWWMAPSTIDVGGCNGFGHYGGTIGGYVTNEGALSLDIVGVTHTTDNNFVIEQEWHHYAISFDGETVTFYRDGVKHKEVKAGAPTEYNLTKFVISRHDYPWNGSVDEFRIWGSCLSEEQLQGVCNRSLANAEALAAVEDMDLLVYYNFDQGTGTYITDHSGNGNSGVREGFGPDGDAWGASKGVWSLSIGQQLNNGADVTATYLKNYRQAFAGNTGNPVNPTNRSRFYAINDWTLENTVTTTTYGHTVTGAHVDAQKEKAMTITTGWDYFASSLTDHKIYQTVTLPAGHYRFRTRYGVYEAQCENCYLVVSKAGAFPNTDDLNSAIAYTAMQSKDKVLYNEASFILKEETEVCLGLLVNMSGERCLTIHSFELHYKEANYEEAPYSFTLGISQNGFSTLCLPEATEIPAGSTAYIATQVDTEAQRLHLSPVEGNVLPAEVGVVVYAPEAAGRTIIFRKAESEATDLCEGNLLYGTLEEEERTGSDACFSISEKVGKTGFYPHMSSTLLANRAYYFGEDLSGYHLILTDTGLDTDINGITIGNGGNAIYDLSGRRVKNPTKGVYIMNGKKVIK